ncbi:hypothetical protein HPB47_001311 [Ixodes persulcatus]|uniref:Uncharacterized protein n=1 Tax=Ixodes persulcatus TaxID=34615 RepID=A0AC60PPD1_IXOPE|nr:hypothetical protein HPB47_001311 [Ixodes persulcatus]
MPENGKPALLICWQDTEAKVLERSSHTLQPYVRALPAAFCDHVDTMGYTGNAVVLWHPFGLFTNTETPAASSPTVGFKRISIVEGSGERSTQETVRHGADRECRSRGGQVFVDFHVSPRDAVTVVPAVSDTNPLRSELLPDMKLDELAHLADPMDTAQAARQRNAQLGQRKKGCMKQT